ncbi:MAG: IclR family transcriptional regulator [Acidimicrobiales bacterium]
MTAADSPVGGARATLNGVERALEVLCLFAQAGQPTLGVTEIAETLGLSKAVVHRTLSACRSKGFVDLDPASHRYRLGLSSLQIGVAYLDALDLRAIAREILSDLVAATRETATLSIRSGWSRVYVDQAVPERDVRMTVQIGRPFPMHAGASSKAMLAFLEDADRDEYLDSHDLAPLTSRTISDAPALRSELTSIRRRGYAVSLGERDAGAGSVAAPVFDVEGRLAAVISVCGPVERFSSEIEAASAELLAACSSVSRRLGYRLPGSERVSR